jgi:hypothetical protein
MTGGQNRLPVTSLNPDHLCIESIGHPLCQRKEGAQHSKASRTKQSPTDRGRFFLLD